MSGASKRRLNLVTIGHFKSGKSSTIGRILFELGKWKDHHVDEQDTGQRKNTFADYMHKTVLEKQAGHSIHSTPAVELATNSYYYSIFDAPGHHKYIKNMICSAAHCDVALLVISAQDFPKEFDKSIQKNDYKKEILIGGTRHHSQICYALGIHRMIVVLNKMDTLQTNAEQKQCFDRIKQKTNHILDKIGYNTNKIAYIPISALKGFNLLHQTKACMQWYNGFKIQRKKHDITGFTLMDALEKTIRIPKRRSIYKPFRMQIRDLYNITNVGTVACGTIQQGTLTSDTPVHLYPHMANMEKIAVTGSLEIFHNSIYIAQPGDHVGVQLLTDKETIRNIQAGDVMLSKQNDSTMRIYVIRACVVRFIALIRVRFVYKMRAARFVRSKIWTRGARMYRSKWIYGYQNGYCTSICVQNSRAFCELIRIHWRKRSCSRYQEYEYNPSFIEFDDIAQVEFRVINHCRGAIIALTSFKEYGPLGRIIGMDHNQMMFYGKVVAVVDDAYYNKLLVDGYIRINMVSKMKMEKMKRVSYDDISNLVACYVSKKFVYKNGQTIFDYERNSFNLPEFANDQ